MNTSAIIREKLETALSPLQLRILDESAHHAGHAGAREGGSSHFRVEIISSQFAGLNRVARHRLVYQALGDAFSQGLHALQIIAKAPGE